MPSIEIVQNSIEIRLGSYRIQAVQQSDPDAWLVKEWSDNQLHPINTFAVTSKKLTETILPTLTQLIEVQTNA